jgi:TonB family protein
VRATWGQSIGIHAGLALLFIGSVWFSSLSFTDKKEILEVPIELTVPDEPAPLKELEKKKPIIVKSVNTAKKTPVNKKKTVRQVYGASRNSITTKTNKGIDFKRGNTLAKEVDKKKLTKDDVDALPSPTEEYLVSQMPQVLTEVRPKYPEKAKAERKEGQVVLSVLVDAKGVVRQVRVIEGDEIFRSPALKAMKKFKFRAATMEGKNVAVRIRYTLRFVLEN